MISNPYKAEDDINPLKKSFKSSEKLKWPVIINFRNILDQIFFSSQIKVWNVYL